MPQIEYPTALETHWINIAKAETNGTAIRDILHRLLPDIRRLADRFTIARPDPSTDTTPYLRDTRTCAAYSLFFAPQTYARLTHILTELPSIPATLQPLRVLDLGAGTGAASWALLDHLGPTRPVALTTWDHSRAAIRCLHDLFTALRHARWPNATLRTQCSPLCDFLPGTEKYDIILIHYTLNELPSSARRTLIARATRALSPHGHLILCEPLLHDAGDYMRDLRTHATHDLGLHILAPCPHEQPCPLGEPCHSIRSWKISQALQILNGTLHRDLRHLAFAYLALTPAPLPVAENIRARVVGSPTHAKGQTTCPACCPCGKIQNLQHLHRDYDTHGRKTIRHLERGDPLHLASITPLGDPTLFRATPIT